MKRNRLLFLSRNVLFGGALFRGISFGCVLLLVSACNGETKTDKKPAGSYCQGNTDCADDICHRDACAPKLGDAKEANASCTFDHECKSWRCSGGKCAAQGTSQKGAPCLLPDECSSNVCDGPRGSGTCGDTVREDGGTHDAGVDMTPDLTPDTTPQPDSGIDQTPDTTPQPDSSIDQTADTTQTPDIGIDQMVDTAVSPDMGCTGNPGACDDQLSCTVDTCEQGVCKNTVKPYTCLIAGSCYLETEKNPQNPCEKCVGGATGATSWTPDTNTVCNDENPCTSGDKCNASGVCQGVDYSATCFDTPCEKATCDGKGGCQKTLKPNKCLIGTTNPVCVDDISAGPGKGLNPLNACEGCVSAYDPTRWTNVDGPGCMTTVVKRGGYNDGPLASATLQSARALAYDATGNRLFILDKNSSAGAKIRTLDFATKRLETLVGPVGQNAPARGDVDGSATAATFYNPQDIAYDENNKLLYVADYQNHLLRVVDLNVSPSAGFVGTAAGISGQSGTTDGAVGSATLSYPFSLDVDSTGKVYFVSGNVRVYDPSGAGGLGSVSTVYTGYPYSDVTLLSDSEAVGNINGHRVVTIDLGGANSATLIGDQGASCGNGAALTQTFIRYPVGFSVLGSGTTRRIYMVGHQDHSLRKLESGVVSTVVGICGSHGSKDGSQSEAQLRSPNDTLIVPGGSGQNDVIYIADDNGLRRFTLP
jgi:hypothetical protein